MKKAYITPATATLRLSTEGLMATSTGENSVPVYEEEGQNEEQFSGEREWNTGIWGEE